VARECLNRFQGIGCSDTDGFYGDRLFAARDENGAATADCRINGQDFPAGAQALAAYVQSWPQRAIEFRKQYIAIQTVAAAPQS